MNSHIEWLCVPNSEPRFKLTNEEWKSKLLEFVDNYQIEQHYLHPDGHHDMQIMPAWIEYLETDQSFSSDMIDGLKCSWRSNLQAYLDTVEDPRNAISAKPLYWDHVPHLVKGLWVKAAIDLSPEDESYHFNCDSSSEQYLLIDWNLE